MHEFSTPHLCVMLSTSTIMGSLAHDCVGQRNLCVLPVVFVATSECGLSPIDIQQSLSWRLVNSGRFLRGQRRELMGAWPGSYCKERGRMCVRQQTHLFTSALEEDAQCKPVSDLFMLFLLPIPFLLRKSIFLVPTPSNSLLTSLSLYSSLPRSWNILCFLQSAQIKSTIPRGSGRQQNIVFPITLFYLALLHDCSHLQCWG